MPITPDPQIAQMAGPEALPRKNGELVFDALWEGRLFGLATALHERGLYPWREFRDRLAAEIGAADASGTPSSYYARFLQAFETLVVARGFVTQAELDARTAAYAADEDDAHDHHH